MFNHLTPHQNRTATDHYTAIGTLAADGWAVTFGTLAADGWAVTFGTARRGIGTAEFNVPLDRL